MVVLIAETTTTVASVACISVAATLVPQAAVVAPHARVTSQTVRARARAPAYKHCSAQYGSVLERHAGLQGNAPRQPAGNCGGGRWNRPYQISGMTARSTTSITRQQGRCIGRV